MVNLGIINIPIGDILKLPPTFFFLFLVDWGWTQGFALARQALHHLRHTSSPFCSEDGASFFAQAGLKPQSSYLKPPSLTGMTGMHHQAQIFHIEMGSRKLFHPGWPRTSVLLRSTSHVAGMAGVTHWRPGGIIFDVFVIICLRSGTDGETSEGAHSMPTALFPILAISETMILWRQDQASPKSAEQGQVHMWVEKE
jgi:hypothetical protein